MPRFYFDCETWAIQPGLLAPPLVCLQYAYDDAEPQIVLRDEARAVFLKALQAPDTSLVAFNGAFDYAVLAAAFPDLLPLIYRALANKRARDLLIREILKTIKDGTLRFATKQRGYFRLASVAARYLHKEVQKGEDSWQVRYDELDDVPLEQWPPEAVEYCKEDIRLLQELEQCEELSPDPHLAGYDYPDEWMQAFSAFTLHLEAVWGCRIDPAKLDAVELELLRQQEGLLEILTSSGLMVDGTMKVEVARDLIVKACEEKKIAVPRTPKGNVKTDEATVEEVAPGSPPLEARVAYNGNQKVLSTYLKPMRAGTVRAMNSRPNVLVASGRTSWAGTEIDGVREGTNLQNFPKKGGVRECFAPRPGFVWLGVDYASLELHTLAQACLWICGRSRLAEGFQKDRDYDPLTEFGSQLAGMTVQEALALKGKGGSPWKAFKEGPRQNAKAALYGLPGGMGARKFRDTARKQYGLELSMRQTYSLIDGYFKFLPEMRDYFKYVNYISEKGVMRQFVSGRLRGGIGYPDCANSYFQGLAADGAKMANNAVSLECYAAPESPLFGSRILAFVHDELDLEVPEDKAHETAMRVVHLMESEMNKVTPDVPNKAVPALSRCWLKDAEEVYRNGRLICWEDR
jgi:DNA polymerase I-like protein with 3'-5' exonuclease and polymerase domains